MEKTIAVIAVEHAIIYSFVKKVCDDYFAWYKENGKNWDHWVGTL